MLIPTQSEAPAFDTEASELSHPVPPIYYGGTIHAVWKLGEAYIKLMIPDGPAITREHTTLQALANLQLGFAVPEVLFHGEWNGRYVLITRRLPGQTISQAWPTLSEDDRTLCISKMTQICKEMSAIFGPGSAIAGIDGGQLSERYFGSQSGRTWDFSPSLMRQNCAQAGLDTSQLVFYHCDLTPGNVLIDFNPEGHLAIGIIDWECAGFVPADWVRTKVVVGPAFDFEFPEDSTEEQRRDWRERLQVGLKDEGFEDVSDSFLEWWSKQ